MLGFTSTPQVKPTTFSFNPSSQNQAFPSSPFASKPLNSSNNISAPPSTPFANATLNAATTAASSMFPSTNQATTGIAPLSTGSFFNSGNTNQAGSLSNQFSTFNRSQTQTAGAGIGTSVGFSGFQSQPQMNTWNTSGQLSTNNNLSNQNFGIFSESLRDIKSRYAPYVDGYGNPILQPTDQYARSNQNCKFSSISYKRYNQTPITSLLDIPRGDDIDGNNPDPETYFGVKEYGIIQLEARFNEQTATIEKNSKNLKEIRDIVESMDRKANHLMTRYEGLRSKHAVILLSLLRILRKIEVLRHRGTGLSSKEIEYRDNLDKVVKAMYGPNKKLQELMLVESQVEVKPDVFVEDVSAEDMTTLFTLLEKQREGIEALADLLSKDTRSVAVISKGIGRSKQII